MSRPDPNVPLYLSFDTMTDRLPKRLRMAIVIHRAFRGKS